MGINDLFDSPVNPKRIDGSSEQYVPYAKEIEYRKRIRELQIKNIDLAIERHKIFMDNIAFYRQNHYYPEDVNNALKKISEKEDDNNRILNITKAKYNSYCKHWANR